ncbi:MAG: molybdopterin-guanine dinucleotide biosynthesis protein MobB, partial [Thermodesulfovibrionales bacterium]
MKRPLVIGIGGGHSGSGKTTLASALLAHLSSVGERWGAVKYTKTAIYCSIIDDREILCQKDKDTERFFRSGAVEVLWVQSPEQELGEVVPMAIDRLSHLDGIILEGNSAIEFLKPDVVLFLSGDSHRRPKASGERLLSTADIIIVESPPEGMGEPKGKPTCT